MAFAASSAPVSSGSYASEESTARSGQTVLRWERSKSTRWRGYRPSAGSLASAPTSTLVLAAELVAAIRRLLRSRLVKTVKSCLFSLSNAIELGSSLWGLAMVQVLHAAAASGWQAVTAACR